MASDDDHAPADSAGGILASAARISAALWVLWCVGLLCMMWQMSPPLRTTPLMRHNKAKAEVFEVFKAIGIYRTLTGRMPGSFADLRRPLAQNDGDPVIDFDNDPWGRPYGFTIDGSRAVTISCLGADGAPGGRGTDEDIEVTLSSTGGVVLR